MTPVFTYKKQKLLDLKMIDNLAYVLISVVIVSLISLLMALPLLIKKKVSKKTLLFLLSVSVGVLLSTVFMDLLPEVMSYNQSVKLSFYILFGFLLMFILENLVHSHHKKKVEEKAYGHGHTYHLAPINLIGDGIHNFIDGLLIAGSYAVDLTLGITTTIAVIFHEIPQEIADFGVLLYTGMSKKKALIFNFFSALTAIIGALTGLILVGKLQGFTEFIIPFAAGNFIYIAASNLVPQLHRQCELKDTLMHLLAIILGIVIITLITLYGPGH